MSDFLIFLAGFVCGGTLGAAMFAKPNSSPRKDDPRHDLGTALLDLLYALDNYSPAGLEMAVEAAKASLKRYGWRR
jgi:hypothetical protein